jgi:type I restriction enzyme M protein
MENISTELSEQFRKSEELEKGIKENLAGPGYGL